MATADVANALHAVVAVAIADVVTTCAADTAFVANVLQSVTAVATADVVKVLQDVAASSTYALFAASVDPIGADKPVRLVIPVSVVATAT